MRFTKDHMWVKREDGVAIIGLTAFGQESLGRIDYVELPEPGARVSAGDEAVIIECPDSTREMYAPLSGVVVEVNDDLADSPALVLESPEDEGWLFKLKPADPAEWEDLLDRAEYDSHLESMIE